MREWSRVRCPVPAGAFPADEAIRDASSAAPTAAPTAVRPGIAPEEEAAMQRQDWITHLEALSGGAAQWGPLPPDPTLLAGERGEQCLWRACAGEPVAVEEVLGSRRGSLLAPDAFLAIEVWAECELSALHALHRLARLSGPVARARLRARALEAIRWHLEHTQPDNSTNRPWALHAFLLAEGCVGGGTDDASLYAETLLHNMCATDARNEPLSRWILADAARELRLAAAS